MQSMCFLLSRAGKGGIFVSVKQITTLYNLCIFGAVASLKRKIPAVVIVHSHGTF